jgi:hypothetical protein
MCQSYQSNVQKCLYFLHSENIGKGDPYGKGTVSWGRQEGDGSFHGKPTYLKEKFTPHHP